MPCRPFVPAFAAFACLLGVSSAAAHEGHSVVVDVQGPVLAPAAAVMTPQHAAHHAPPIAAPQAALCHPIRVLREVATLSAKRAYRCHGAPVHQTLCVDNPADCCHKLYAVAVCVPACCVDTPVCVSSDVGLLGRGHVVYRWKCGFEAVITFRVHGGVLITYR
ncbi:MAG: hypothetical protein AAF790_05495 [Planctomycetota bacterium]